jgi:5-methylcytosine-specific restriction endonuclease McrA
MKNCPKCFSDHTKPGIFCSRVCANSRVWSDEDKRKKSETNRKTYAEKAHLLKGKVGRSPSTEQREVLRRKSLEYWDRVGRLPKEHYILKNRECVARYGARKRDAVPPDADVKLIQLIYKRCPKGYDVDHIIAISEGGLHHQDNLQYLPSVENKRKGKTQNYDRSLAISWKELDDISRAIS